MVNSNANALGIIFPNSYDSYVSELVSERLMASIPFAGRYRMVDFVLSSMVTSGIDNISILVRNNYHSLMDHLGSGREWDLTRKNGGLSIYPPYSEKGMKVYAGRVDGLASILETLKDQKEKYVVMTDSNIAVNFDFKAMLDAHIASGADVTVAYAKEEIPAAMKNNTDYSNLYFTLKLADGRVEKMYINSQEDGVQNLSMNIYIMDRELLIKEITAAFVRGFVY
ncbi:MAG: glucose-1-phosphate adenylyltransferase subunit GlgD, partial [Lachnospiraceae bacterium]|nr:glucose-1-phosphate adenylyltransferase subunit GlgD [Lachnospiraceae bacterium]